MPAIVRNVAREKLEQGQLSLGVGVRMTRSVEIAKAMAVAGFDWLFLDGGETWYRLPQAISPAHCERPGFDMEHGVMPLEACAQISTAAWDGETGTEIAVLKGHERSVRSAAFNPDGRRVETASSDGTARLWDGEMGAEIAVLRGHEGSVWNAAFSPDGRRVATASFDRTARLWDGERSCSMLSVYMAVRVRPFPKLPPLEQNGCGPSTLISPA